MGWHTSIQLFNAAKCVTPCSFVFGAKVLATIPATHWTKVKRQKLQNNMFLRLNNRENLRLSPPPMPHPRRSPPPMPQPPGNQALLRGYEAHHCPLIPLLAGAPLNSNATSFHLTEAEPSSVECLFLSFPSLKKTMGSLSESSNQNPLTNWPKKTTAIPWENQMHSFPGVHPQKTNMTNWKTPMFNREIHHHHLHSCLFLYCHPTFRECTWFLELTRTSWQRPGGPGFMSTFAFSESPPWHHSPKKSSWNQHSKHI